VAKEPVLCSMGRAGETQEAGRLPVLARVSRVRLLKGHRGWHQQGSAKTQSGSCRNDPWKQLWAGTKGDAQLKRATTRPGLYPAASWL